MILQQEKRWTASLKEMDNLSMFAGPANHFSGVAKVKRRVDSIASRANEQDLYQRPWTICTLTSKTSKGESKEIAGNSINDYA
jgi:hypothetical protein